MDGAFLIRHFGKSYGAWLLEAAHGRDDRPVITERDCKSISRETTFERDLHPKQDREALSKVLQDLCARLSGDLERKGCRAKTVGIKLRFENFKTLTRDVTLPSGISEAKDILQAARSCLRRVTLDRRLRLLGIRLGSLVPVNDQEELAFPQATPSRVSEPQPSLFPYSALQP